MMAAVGLGQHALLCPEDADADLVAMEAALAQMLSAEGRAFDTREYRGIDISKRLHDDRGSVALLGYGGLALSLHRALDPDSPFVDVEQAFVEALALRMAGGLVETYPGQVYPVDNAAGVAALNLHDRTTGQDHSAAVAATTAAIAAARHDPTGTLYQRTRLDGLPMDRPRASGTFLTGWFLHRADPALACSLYEDGLHAFAGDVMGLPAMREYPAGLEGDGDRDSGPLVMGYSISATGFAIGAATACGDEATAAALRGTAQLADMLAVGMVPGLGTADAESATGSHLGDAILLAMVTAGGMP